FLLTALIHNAVARTKASPNLFENARQVLLTPGARPNLLWLDPDNRTINSIPYSPSLVARIKEFVLSPTFLQDPTRHRPAQSWDRHSITSLSDPELADPIAIASDENGKIYVLDHLSRRVFTINGRRLKPVTTIVVSELL